MELGEATTKIRGIWAVIAVCVVAGAGFGVADQLWLCGAFLLFGIAAMVFAATTGDHGEPAPPGVIPSPPTESTVVAPYPVDEPWGGPPVPAPADASALDLVVFKHLLTSEKKDHQLGRAGGTDARFFVDLREAALTKAQLDVLVHHFAEHIRGAGISPRSWQILAVPKSGNTVLGLALAEELGLAPMLVREEPLNGRYVECAKGSGRVILIDDVASDADLLLPAAVQIRRAGYVCTRAAVLILRSEGSLNGLIGGEGTDLNPGLPVSAYLHMGDAEFAELVERVRAT